MSNQKQSVLVWDFPVRIFHWLLVISFAGAWLTSESDAHEVTAYLALWLIIIHIVAAVAMSFLQKENLSGSMVTGKKQGTPEQAIRYPMYVLGVILAFAWAIIFYLVFSGALPTLTR